MFVFPSMPSTSDRMVSNLGLRRKYATDIRRVNASRVSFLAVWRWARGYYRERLELVGRLSLFRFWVELSRRVALSARSIRPRSAAGDQCAQSSYDLGVFRTIRSKKSFDSRPAAAAAAELKKRTRQTWVPRGSAVLRHAHVHGRVTTANSELPR